MVCCFSFILFFQKKNNISAADVPKGVCHETQCFMCLNICSHLSFQQWKKAIDHVIKCAQIDIALKDNFSCNLLTPISSCTTYICYVIQAAMYIKIVPLYINEFTHVYFIKHGLSLMSKQFWEHKLDWETLCSKKAR